MQEKIHQLSKEVASHLTRRQQTLVTAESCTGGGIGACLTDVAGSSSWFLGGIISYSNAVKVKLLSVEESTLQQYGAVSEKVVEQMAKSAIASFDADYAVAVSGVAGPGGGSEEKSVGTVWIAWAHQSSQGGIENISTQQYQFLGNRNAVRQQTIMHALDELNHQLSS